MLVDAHERKAQIRLARVALGVADDETPPDPVAQERAGARVKYRRPQHEARDGVVPVTDAEREIARKTPQHTGEGAEQDRGLEQSDAEISRQLAQLAGIFVYALIRIDAHRSRT